MTDDLITELVQMSGQLEERKRQLAREWQQFKLAYEARMDEAEKAQALIDKKIKLITDAAKPKK